MTTEQLLHLRKERRLTRVDIAKQLGCLAGAIVQWERGLGPSWRQTSCKARVDPVF